MIVVAFRYLNKHNQITTDVEYIHTPCCLQHYSEKYNYNAMKKKIETKFNHAKQNFIVAILKFSNAKFKTAVAKLNAGVTNLNYIVA